MDIKAILAAHKEWLENPEKGAKANLSEANLSGADLSEANLSGADLSEANLRWAAICNHTVGIPDDLRDKFAILDD